MDNPELPDTAALEGLLERLEERLNGYEEMIAHLMMGFTEMWAALETIIAQVMTTRTDEEQEAFRKSYDDFRSNLLKEISAVGVEKINPDVAASLQDMVLKHGTHSADTPPDSSSSVQNLEDLLGGSE